MQPTLSRILITTAIGTFALWPVSASAVKPANAGQPKGDKLKAEPGSRAGAASRATPHSTHAASSMARPGPAPPGQQKQKTTAQSVTVGTGHTAAPAPQASPNALQAPARTGALPGAAPAAQSSVATQASGSSSATPAVPSAANQPLVEGGTRTATGTEKLTDAVTDIAGQLDAGTTGTPAAKAPPSGTGGVLGAVEPIATEPIAMHAQQAGTVGDAYLSGLINVNVQNLNLQAQDVIDVSNVLNNDDLEILVQALTSDTYAQQNASRLTENMMSQGLLHPDETVVGRTQDGTVLKKKRNMS